MKPGILKLIQSKVDAIVKELCDEGFCEQQTIMNVLEQRASKLFPENFMISTANNFVDSAMSHVDPNAGPLDREYDSTSMVGSSQHHASHINATNMGQKVHQQLGSGTL